MKGGKGGRPRKTAGGGAARHDGGPRAKPPRKGAAGRPATDGPPKKGSRKKPDFGGRSSTGED